MRDTAYRVLQAKEKFISEHQREPSIEEIAKLLELKREDVVFALDAIVDPVSLYEPVYSDSGDTICVMDQVRDSKNTDENWLEQIALREAIAKLSDREKRILSLRFFQGKTQMEVSTEVGISQPRCPAWRRTPCARSKGPVNSRLRAALHICRLSPGYVQDHHEQEPGHYPQSSAPGGVVLQVGARDQLLHDHIQHGAGCKGEQPGHQRLEAAHHQDGEQGENGLHDAGQGPHPKDLPG